MALTARRTRWHASWRTVTVAALVTALGSVALLRSDAERDAPADSAGRAPLPAPDAGTGLAAYATALAPLAAEGGQIVAEGLRPGLADIAQAAYPDDVLVRMASGWVASMRDVRDAVAALPAAAGAATVAVQVERALAVYIRTAETLLDAARATGDERTVLIDRAAALGRTADRLYDAATVALADLSPSPPTPTPSERP